MRNQKARTLPTVAFLKKLLFALLLIAKSQIACGFDFAQVLAPPSRQVANLRYVGLFHEKSDFTPNRARTEFHLLDFNTPIYKNETEVLGLSFYGSQRKVTPNQGDFSHLYEVKFGASYKKTIEEGRVWAVIASYGSASDKPFKDPSVNTLGITGLYTIPSDASSSWALIINYSNNRPILNNIPLPGFAWFFNPNKDFRLVLGAPFAMTNWQFAENWGVTAFALIPWTIKSSLYYKLTPYAQASLGMDFSQETYFRYGREKKEERLFYDERKIYLGLKSPLSKSVYAELEMGHAFDRSFFEAKNYEIHPDERVEFGNAYYAKITLRLLLP